MGRFRVLSGILSALLLVMAIPGVARAGSAVLLGFGEEYRLDGAVRTHHGIDVSAAAGATAVAFAGGEVSFAGKVPSDEGATAFAVTIDTGNSLVTVHPLEECWVDEGDRVVEGDGLGTVAASGDSSSAAPHLHLSVRVGGGYVDPSYLLAAPATEGGTTVSEPDPVPVAPSAAVPVAAAPVVAATAGPALTIAAPRPVSVVPEPMPEGPITSASSRSVDIVHLSVVKESGALSVIGDEACPSAASASTARGFRRTGDRLLPQLPVVPGGVLAAIAFGLASLAVMARRQTVLSRVADR